MSLKRSIRNFIAQIFLTVAGFVIASLPTIFYLLLKYLLAPQGFWQNLILAGLGLYCFGFVQVCLAIVFIWWLFIVWAD